MRSLKPYLGTVIVVLVTIAVFKLFLTPMIKNMSPTIGNLLPS